MAAVTKIDGKEVTPNEFEEARKLTIPEQIDGARVKLPDEAELEVLVEALKRNRTAQAGYEGEMAAKELIFATENQILSDNIKLCKATEIELSNKIRYLALKAHTATKKKGFMSYTDSKGKEHHKVAIKLFTIKDYVYSTEAVMRWARKLAPILIVESLDDESFKKILATKLKIEDGGKVIAEYRENVEPRAQISKTL